MKDLGYRLRHWWWRLRHPVQCMGARRYARTAGKTPPPEFWERAHQQAPTAGYCQRHKRAEPIDSWCHNEGAPMNPERRKRLMEWRADDAIADEEIRTGKVRRFATMQDALAWLDSDDGELEES
jgi:hypothetical protein